MCDGEVLVDADVAATEPGLDGREDEMHVEISAGAESVPLRSPASTAGKTCIVSSPTGWLSRPLRSPASTAGKTRGERIESVVPEVAATEPGLDGREDAFVLYGVAR